MTLFSWFARSQPSGNTGGQKDTLRLPCLDANWIEHTKSKARNTDALATLYDLAEMCWDVFFNLGSSALEMLQASRYLNLALASDRCKVPGKTIIWEWRDFQFVLTGSCVLSL